jgi:hypothetical protein
MVLLHMLVVWRAVLQDSNAARCKVHALALEQNIIMLHAWLDSCCRLERAAQQASCPIDGSSKLKGRTYLVRTRLYWALSFPVDILLLLLLLLPHRDSSHAVTSVQPDDSFLQPYFIPTGRYQAQLHGVC